MSNREEVQPQRQALHADALVLVVNRSGDVLSVTQPPDRSSADPQSLAGSNVGDIWSAPVASRLKKIISRALRSRKFQTEEIINARDDGNCEFICVPQGQDRALLVVRDLSQLSQDRDKLQQLAYRDELTGLPNREFLITELGNILDQVRLQEARAAVICIHVEQFDDRAFGMATGSSDDVLRELGSRLMIQLRGINETTQPDLERFSLVARSDFREFAIALPSIESGEDAESVALRVLGALRQPVTINGRESRVTVAAGIAVYPQDGDIADEIFANARAAMEDARHGPDEGCRFHSGTVRLKALQRQDMVADMRASLERGDFSLEYQPVVSAATGRLRSVEALLRWPRTVLGASTTRKIIAIAEYTGLIVDIGEWVLRRACEDYRQWRDVTGMEFLLAVNLSPQEFARPDLAARIAAILDETGVDPANVEIEIRESMVTRDALQGFATCRSLRDVGVGLLVDDYGTGSSVLAQLAECPVDGCKIDASFVANIESNKQDQATCRAAIAVAHSLEKLVIAEGVETEAQAEFLRDKGCDYLQGFLLAKPLPASGVAVLLEAAEADGGEVCAS